MAGDKQKGKPATAEGSEDDEDGAEADEQLSPEHEEPEILRPEKTNSRPNSRPHSRRASSFANTDTGIVPRAQRRGLLGRVTVIPEIEEPLEYKNSTKWMITGVVALAAAGAPMGSGIFLRK